MSVITGLSAPISKLDASQLRALAQELPGPRTSCPHMCGPLYDLIEERARVLGITVIYNDQMPFEDMQ